MMKNIVEVIYSKGERYPKILINGEKISRYMELSDLIYDDIFNWADRLYESMDDELCESYCIRLTGHVFHYQVLKELQSLSQYCSEVSFTPIMYKISVADKLLYASELNSKYHLDVPQVASGVSFFTDEPERFFGIVPCADSPSEYYITAGSMLPQQNVKYCVMLSEKVFFEKVRGISVLHLPMNMLNELVDYLNIYHCNLDFISAVFTAIHELSLSDDERMKYEAYLYEEYRVRVNSLPQTINTGERYSISYTYYPLQFDDPMIFVNSSDQSVLSAADGTIFARNPGVATVILSDKFGTSYGSYTVNVEHHNYVTDISVVLPGTTLLVNGVLRFKCLISPSDAEDFNSVRYTISNTSVAAFSGQNEIYGIAPGRVKVTVSATKIKKSFYVTVLPVAKAVLLPQEVLSMPVNANADINCSVFPANATPMPAVFWQSSNPEVVQIVASRGFSCRVVSHEVGSAMLKCSLAGTDISKVMRIDVEKERGCYVATAVYGSYDCPQVWLLRRYRDQFLAAHSFGRAFIKVYYALSPVAVRWFGHTGWFNRLCRGILDKKILKLKRHGYEDTPYND